MFLGLSTGAIWRKLNPISEEAIDICRALGCGALELCALTTERVESLGEIVKSKTDLSGFKYISLHAPAIGVKYKNDPQTRELLVKIENAYRKLGCENLVIHPLDIEELDVFEGFSFSLALENMSRDTAPLYLPEHLRNIFEKNEKLKMTFDVKHAFESGGKKLAEDLYETFKDRIVEIHLSGYNPQAERHEHKPLIETKQREIVEFVKDKRHLPIIIESDCDDVEQMKSEYEHIKNLLA